MTEDEFAILRDEVLKADHERLCQAGWLALCELGPEPDEIADFIGFCKMGTGCEQKGGSDF